jgi:hypothetical protein
MTAMVASANAIEAERRVNLALIRELEPHFADTLSRDTVSSCVLPAVTDLRGSVCTDALPEMAARLARHRLGSAIDAIDNVTAARLLLFPA